MHYEEPTYKIYHFPLISITQIRNCTATYLLEKLQGKKQHSTFTIFSQILLIVFCENEEGSASWYGHDFINGRFRSHSTSFVDFVLLRLELAVIFLCKQIQIFELFLAGKTVTYSWRRRWKTNSLLAWVWTFLCCWWTDFEVRFRGCFWSLRGLARTALADNIRLHWE